MTQTEFDFLEDQRGPRKMFCENVVDSKWLKTAERRAKDEKQFRRREARASWCEMWIQMRDGLGSESSWYKKRIEILQKPLSDAPGNDTNGRNDLSRHTKYNKTWNKI